MTSVVVAGHVCIDLIPRLPSGARSPRPGALEPVGPLTFAIGGCVGNTGVALHRLGLPTTLVARVGDDPLGRLLTALVRAAVPPAACRLQVTPGAATSYSLITNRPGEDRGIAHFAGVNDRFVAADVPAALLARASHLHVGYPPLMAAMVADDGRELVALLRTAREHGATTSVDMAAVRTAAGERGVDWRRLLAAVLPHVDVFLPSLDEVAHMLGRRVRRDAVGRPTLASVARIADELLELGVAVAGVKLGAAGLYARTADAGAPAASRLPDPWRGRELYAPVFEADVIGTTGAGDATVAGFLFGLLSGMAPDDAIVAACAVGGASTEAVDGTSSVPAWPVVAERLADGWRQAPARLGPGWTPPAGGGAWHGPRDRTARRS